MGCRIPRSTLPKCFGGIHFGSFGGGITEPKLFGGSFSTYSWNFFAYSQVKLPYLTHFPTVSKKGPTVSKVAKTVCKKLQL